MKDLTLEQCIAAYRNIRAKNKWSDSSEQFLLKNGWENLHGQIMRHVANWEDFQRAVDSAST